MMEERTIKAWDSMDVGQAGVQGLGPAAPLIHSTIRTASVTVCQRLW